MLNWIKKVVANKKAKNQKQKLNITYTNEITFLDIDKHEINIKIRNAGDKNFLYLHVDNKELVFDQDAAYFLISILTDYAENGNLNKIEEILETEE